MSFAYRFPRLSKAIAIDYNLITVMLYFISGSGFPTHLCESKAISCDSRYTTPLTEGPEQWPMAAYNFYMIFLCGFSLCLLHTNHKSMPSKTQRVFGVESLAGDAASRRADEALPVAPKVVSKPYSATYKSVVSTSSLLALMTSLSGSSRAMFTLELIVCIVIAVGNFFAQFTNFTSQRSQDDTGTWIHRKLEQHAAGASKFFALCYAFSNAGLYFNTIDQATVRLGLSHNKMHEYGFDHGAEWAALNTLHIAGLLVFTLQTYFYYQHNIERDIKNSAPLYNPVGQSLFSQRFSLWSIVSATYKSIATAFSLAGVTTAILGSVAKENISSVLALSALVSLFSLPSQLCFYCKSKEEATNYNHTFLQLRPYIDKDRTGTSGSGV